MIADRAEDFHLFVNADVAERQAAEDASYAALSVDLTTGEVPDDDDGHDE